MQKRVGDRQNGVGLTVILCAAAVISTLAVIAAAVKGGHGLKTLALSAAQGIVALFAVNVLGTLTGVTVGVNAVSVFISCIGGISGVIMLLVMNALFLK